VVPATTRKPTFSNTGAGGGSSSKSNLAFSTAKGTVIKILAIFCSMNTFCNVIGDWRHHVFNSGVFIDWCKSQGPAVDTIKMRICDWCAGAKPSVRCIASVPPSMSMTLTHVAPVESGCRYVPGPQYSVHNCVGVIRKSNRETIW